MLNGVGSLAPGVGGNSQKSGRLASHAGFYTLNRSAVVSWHKTRRSLNLVKAVPESILLSLSRGHSAYTTP
ncbi:hypothetical protein DAPPUDRAFT_263234 [Daphnia pulex]|uniref:Uncharacterized protein n=1 Tax=Daphnia pulex TaxID=6669 RepID=E9HPE0_DAPPU|nr:hypothetical protein DAPPUDRAFT_263234 [Daphnia pulex]|eukprot:EFX66390.1 hypothetical protein DAPPUDRAFT_263234 [Daphnia pulex]